MAYTALYRKFRPLNFDEMVGQEHITKTIKNQITSNRVGHAYLFNGGRGTGKTSAAKILARAINCLNPINGEPCNECEICKAAISGSLTDIVEMDAASNNSVDDIRQIREEVNFLPTLAKYRVYIIDEVHMLSGGAFNALLKTLEEPPEHVKFILATTEPQKLPATILSRCQRFDFKKISNNDISKRLKFVCDESNIEITPEALKIISILSEGAMRDALSILERCLQDGETQIDEDKVKDLVGIPKLEYISKIVESIMDKDIDNAIDTLNEIINQGKDLQNLLWEMIKYCKDVLIYKTSRNLEIYNEDELIKIKELADKTEKQELLNLIYDLSTLENNMKYSSQKTILFQVEIIKLCNSIPQGNTQVNNISNEQLQYLNNKITNLENKISELSTKSMQYVEKTGVNPINNSQKTEKNIQKSQPQQKAQVKTIVDVPVGERLDFWPKIVGNIQESGKMMLYTSIMSSVATQLNDMTVGIAFPKGLTPFGKSVLEKSENINELEKRVSMECGKPMRIKIMDEKQETKKQEVNPVESFAKDLDIPFNIID